MSLRKKVMTLDLTVLGLNVALLGWFSNMLLPTGMALLAMIHHSCINNYYNTTAILCLAWLKL